jgi:hypothetical protein
VLLTEKTVYNIHKSYRDVQNMMLYMLMWTATSKRSESS